MADDDETLNEQNAPLTAEEVLKFGPVVESQVWTLSWVQEARAPIAQAAGKPKLGKVFDDEGKGKAVLIRPCQSRGRRVRSLSPVYTPAMLEANANVFTGWPMYMDHVPAELTEQLAKRGRSVKELGGQVLTPFWQGDFTQEYDAEFGYQQGAVLAEVWANRFIRDLVGENPNLLHTSISAWPTSGKPGPVPWAPKSRGMVIEGIRRQPQGSVDFVPRGGAGGRLLLEGAQPDPEMWPEPKWEPEDRAFVVSLAERTYGSAEMTTPPDFSKMSPAELRTWVQENHAHLAPALAEEAAPTGGGSPTPAAPGGSPALTADDVQRMIAESQQSSPSLTEEDMDARVDAIIAEREEQRGFQTRAHELIESAAGIPASWKTDLKARYAITPEGPSATLVVESETDDKGATLSEMQVLERNVRADLERARDLIAEAQGKPRVKGEGGAKSDAVQEGANGAKKQGGKDEEVPYWRQAFARDGIVESEDDALSIHGIEKVEA